jgi:hypothetical protein
MSFHDEDEISEELVLGEGKGRVGTIVEATLSHRRSVLGALGSAGLLVTGPRDREDLLQQPEINRVRNLAGHHVAEHNSGERRRQPRFNLW